MRDDGAAQVLEILVATLLLSGALFYATSQEASVPDEVQLVEHVPPLASDVYDFVVADCGSLSAFVSELLTNQNCIEQGFAPFADLGHEMTISLLIDGYAHEQFSSTPEDFDPTFTTTKYVTIESAISLPAAIEFNPAIDFYAGEPRYKGTPLEDLMESIGFDLFGGSGTCEALDQIRDRTGSTVDGSGREYADLFSPALASNDAAAPTGVMAGDYFIVAECTNYFLGIPIFSVDRDYFFTHSLREFDGLDPEFIRYPLVIEYAR